MADFDPFDALRDAGRNAVVPEATAVRARGRQRQARQRVMYAATATVVVLGGIGAGVALAGGGAGKAVVGPGSPTPTTEPSATETPSPEPTPSTTPTVEPTQTPSITPLDLTTVDWDSVTLPASVCALRAPVTLVKGAAQVEDDRGNHSSTSDAQGTKYVNVQRVMGQEPNPVYGNVDGTKDAAVHVYCDNNGGTGAGHLQDSIVLFSGASGKLAVLGVALPRHTTNQASYVQKVALSSGRLTFDEHFYTDGDADCCPAGLSHVVWRYAAGTLAYVSSVDVGADLVAQLHLTNVNHNDVAWTVELDGRIPLTRNANGDRAYSGDESFTSMRLLVDGKVVVRIDSDYPTCVAGAPLRSVGTQRENQPGPTALDPGQHTAKVEVFYCNGTDAHGGVASDEVTFTVS